MIVDSEYVVGVTGRDGGGVGVGRRSGRPVSGGGAGFSCGVVKMAR
jgi:hypothetical protein